MIETLDLVRVYAAGARAIDGVSLEIGREQLVTIMGPSGSGKSTLLHLIGGLDRPTSGAVILDGQPLADLSDRDLTLVRRRTIGFVFQAFNLIPVLTVEENVMLPLTVDGRRGAEAERRVSELIELTGLGKCRGQLATEISGGEQQRTAIARALVADPPVILADEPTGNLDSVTGAEVMAVLRTAQRELGRTVVVVTHDPRVAATSDEVIELRDGRISGRLDLTTGRRLARPAERIVTWLARE
jgi:putative ABC transport system ATP-binding protein